MLHESFIRRCLELAERGRHLVGNGAMVGAALVREDRIVVEGFFDGRGPHAECVVLEKFDQKIRSTDVLYVTLEPCVPHPSKKTPGCAPRIIESGIKHVVIGMLDPDTRVSGRGAALLREAGLHVDVGVLRQECEWLNRGFVSVRTKGRPWITLKRAQTPDGRIANDDGSPLKITSPEQDAWSHTFLRATHDAILVGVQTIISDDPSLNTRFDQKKRPFLGLRVVVDPHDRVPKTAKVLTDEYRDRTLVVRDASWDALWQQLLDRGVTSVLVEGGQRTWDAFRRAGYYDEDVILCRARPSPGGGG
jgi:diaminohydroxyphosphoribosylaminopyrimidine deaminase/5-amino-6-(5-phosphoribosylamino)uracil reductase